MAIILNIDTALETAMISISKNGAVVAHLENTNQRDHAAFLQTAVKRLLEKAGMSLQDLNAISVSGGPGSYTGLRVGMASAKGLCYALSIPLIIISSLEAMALSAIIQEPDASKSLFCSMIDARRMEVYTAMYEHDLKEIIAPNALILHSNLYENFLQERQIIFIGSGSDKLRAILVSPNAKFINANIIPDALSSIAEIKYRLNSFSDLHLSEPLYIKDFHTI